MTKIELVNSNDVGINFDRDNQEKWVLQKMPYLNFYINRTVQFII